MIERFLRIKNAIVKALNDLNLNYLWNSENDERIAFDILTTLRPVRIAVEALSRHDMNLLTAEGVLKFLFNALAINNSQLSTTLLSKLKIEISKRRNMILVSLLKFLQNSNSLKITKNNEDVFLV